MGNLLNPIALRLNYNKFWKFNWVSMSRKNYTYLIINDLIFYKFINFFLFFFKLLEKQRVCFSYDLKVYKKSNNAVKIFIFFFPTPFHYQLLKIKTIETLILHIIKRFKLQLKLIFLSLRNNLNFDFFSSYYYFFMKSFRKKTFHKKGLILDLKKNKIIKLNSMLKIKHLNIVLKKNICFKHLKHIFFFNWYFLKKFFKFYKNLKKKLFTLKRFKFISFFKFLDLIFFFKKKLTKLNKKKKKRYKFKSFLLNKSKKNKLIKKFFFDLFLIEKLFFSKIKKKTKFLTKTLFFFRFLKKYYFLLFYFIFFNSLLYLNLKKIRNTYNLSIISIFSYFIDKINKKKKNLEIILIPYKIKKSNNKKCNLKKNLKNLLNFLFFFKKYNRFKFFFFSNKKFFKFLSKKKSNTNNFFELIYKFILKKLFCFFFKFKKKTKKLFFKIFNLILKKIKKNFFLFFLKLNFLSKSINNSKKTLKNTIYIYKKYKIYINFLFQKKKFLTNEKKKKKFKHKQENIYKYKYIIFNSRFLNFFFKKKFKKKPFEIVQIITKIAKILKRKKEINGFKIKLKGRFSKKTRTNKFIYKFGTIVPNTLKCYLDYTEDIFFSKYGLYSIKIWLYLQKNEKKYILNDLIKKKIVKSNLDK